LDGTKQGILLKQEAKDMLKKCHWHGSYLSVTQFTVWIKHLVLQLSVPSCGKRAFFSHLISLYIACYIKLSVSDRTSTM